ncbi:hypothetical protein [Sphaerisporangium rufum]|uniref:hypothetical protein n=1 Tax=Sphaerisporangium rufum TaxID=1381558 RepID=UPI00194E74B1|nr:hypothetical protein [Sphaerisporangium rufum]
MVAAEPYNPCEGWDHCYYDSPTCEGNQLVVQCVRFLYGLPSYGTCAIGSCESIGTHSPGGITVSGEACHPSYGAPDCQPVYLSTRRLAGYA